MTKKQIKNAINKATYQYAETLGYSVHDDNDGSCVTFISDYYHGGDNSIDYSRSQHETYVLNWACDEVKNDAKLIQKFVESEKKKYCDLTSIA